MDIVGRSVGLLCGLLAPDAAPFDTPTPGLVHNSEYSLGTITPSAIVRDSLPACGAESNRPSGSLAGERIKLHAT
jgi:hypothetical protein